MKDKNLLLISLLIFICCSSFEKRVVYKPIIGKWCHIGKHRLNYPSIEFKDNTSAILESFGDTVYRYKYYLKGSYLYLFKDGAVVKNKIIKLKGDTLVFAALLENHSIQRYYRCK